MNYVKSTQKLEMLSKHKPILESIILTSEFSYANILEHEKDTTINTVKITEHKIDVTL
jgi:hypothetical protein